ncbi:MAG: outer membrane beta-barrel protein [Bacteroidales bacterium]|nr:outer membrane beta-barrel protein [Bacteroidales bacterium]
MKNKLIVSILMLFIGMDAAFSQEDTRPRPFELGVFASPALSWLHSATDGYNNKGVTFSGAYGINLDINMFQATSNYFFRTGVNIRHMGGKLTYSEQEFKIDSTITISGSKDVLNKFNMIYISVPTALKLQTNPLADKYIIYSVFGLDNSFCVSSSQQKTEDGKTPENSNKNNKEYTFPVREALILSIGGEYVINNNTRFTVGVMFNNGFTNLFNKKFVSKKLNSETNTIEEKRVEAYNRTIELQVGLIF